MLYSGACDSYNNFRYNNLLLTGFAIRVKRRVPLVEQELELSAYL